MELILSPELLQRAQPRRGHPQAAAKRVSAAKSFKTAREVWAYRRATWLPPAEISDELVELTRRADRLLEGERFPADADVLVAAAAERLLDGHATLAWAAAEARGAAYAFDVIMGSTGFGATTRHEGKAFFWMLTRLQPEHMYVTTTWFDSMRAVLTAADDASYRLALEVAAAMRPSLSLSRRAVLDFCFHTELEWVHADAEEVLAAKDFYSHERTRALLLAAISDPALVDRFAERSSPWAAARYSCDVALAVEPAAAARVLCKLLDRTLQKGGVTRKDMLTLGCALTSLRGEEMARALAPRLHHRRLSSRIASYFRAYPDLAELALAPLAEHKNPLGDAARRILHGHRARVAEEGVTPGLLADPPWRRATPRAVVELRTLPCERRLAWSEAEQGAALHYQPAANSETRDMTPEEVAELEQAPAKHVDVVTKWAQNRWLVLRVPEHIGLPLWNARDSHAPHRFPPTYMLARYGERAIEGMLHRKEPFESLLVVVAPEVARACARALTSRSRRRAAIAWLTRHAEVAAIGLIPPMLGRGEVRSRRAELALRVLAHHGCAHVIREVAARYGEEARLAIDDWLARDPLVDVGLLTEEDLPISELPRPVTREGTPLSTQGLARLLEMMRGAFVEVPYEGFRWVRATFEERSLEELATALFEIWTLTAGTMKDAWMVWAVAWIGGDATVLAISAWAREAARRSDPRTHLVARVLAAAGSDLAVLELSMIARECHDDELSNAIDLELDDVARARGLGRDELFERCVPTLELDTRPYVEFGARRFRLGVGDTLAPYAEDQVGKRLAQLPRPAKDDDPVAARAASERWRALAATAQIIAQVHVPRLESAMVEGRRWELGEIESSVMNHPILSALARRIVWRAGDRTFRVTEDGSLADESDRGLTLERTTMIDIPHPLHLPADVKRAWSQLFADYGIIQPFEQLGRVTHALLDEEKGLARLGRFAGRRVPATRLVATMDAYGWRRYGSRSRQSSAWREVRLSDGRTARVFITFAPSFALSQIDQVSPVVLEATMAQATFGDIVPVDVSEVLRGLEAFG